MKIDTAIQKANIILKRNYIKSSLLDNISAIFVAREEESPLLNINPVLFSL